MLWDFYTRMRTIRRTEETLLELFSKGLLFGTVHTCIGQEPVAVGVVSALDKTKDVVWSNHRGHGHYLALTDDVEGLIAEVMGRATGVCGGIGGSQHLHRGNFYTNGVLGGTVPCAVGSALAEKERGDGAISVVFLGDGALGQGVVYESFNLAALWELPVLFVLEHNGIAQTTPTHLAQAGDLASRPAAFGIGTTSLIADDVVEVHRAAAEIVEEVRLTSHPHFLVLHTVRLMPHSKGDDTRAKTELAGLQHRDSLHRLAETLAALEPVRKTEIEGAVEKRIAAAVEAALAAPHLDLATLPAVLETYS